ncbi:hypothetical protein NE700_22070, partial [Phocaeicola vulgatus]|uniref:hypothetical protein n=1 Tax=Phocaeicola vulgatus TaxID=821 RepID=UPI00210A9688
MKQAPVKISFYIFHRRIIVFNTKIKAPYILSDQFLLAFIELPVSLRLCAEAIRYGMTSQLTIKS